MNQREIARSAGCSVATVNRVLAGRASVDPALRARVLAATAALGYVPPGRRGPTPDPRRRTVAVLLREPTPAAPGAIVHEMLAGITQEAALLRLTASPSLCEGAADLLLAGRPEDLPGLRERLHVGAILLGWEDPRLVRWLASATPCVLVGNFSHLHEPWATLNINHFAGTVQLVEHLHGLGHRRIGFVRSAWAGARGDERLGAFVQALALQGLDPLRPEVARLPADGDARAVVRRARAGVRAWICDSHRCGLAVHTALTAAGLAVPERIALTSFLSLPSAPGMPRLTGIRGPFRALGRAAVRALVAPPEPWEPGRRILLDVELEDGGSTAPA